MSKIAPLSKFTEQETVERFIEGLREAASIARKLAKVQKKQKWVQVAHILDNVVNKGRQFIESKALARQDVLVMLDSERRKLNPPKVDSKSKIILN